MTHLDPDQISYLQNVLGIHSILWPDGMEDPDLNTGPTTGATLVQERGNIDTARLIAVWQRGGARTDEAEALAEKMISAMKVAPTDLYWLTFDEGSVSLPAVTLESLRSRPVPILVFGQETARRLLPVEIQAGQWVDYQDSRYLMTLAPEALLESAEKKRAAWTHLQIVMKAL